MSMYLNAILGLMFVIGLIMILGFVLNKYAPKLDSIKNAKNQSKNLKIIESIRIDSKRKIILFSCHQKNFLLMTGDKDFIISENITIDSSISQNNQNQDEKTLL